jgi:two-component system response regulator BaeR
LRRLQAFTPADGVHTTHATTALLELDRDRLVAKSGHQEIPLTLVEFELLATLLQHPGRIFGREQLMTKVYTDNRIVSDRTIDSHIKKLRKKLAEIIPTQEVIHSVYSVGYKFEV